MTLRRKPSPWQLPHYAVPHGQTSARLEWADLGVSGQRVVEEQLGASVVAVHLRGAGFTPGFAAVVQTSDNQRCFVKVGYRAASTVAYEAYKTEALVLTDLQPLIDTHQIPVPRLRWHTSNADWVCLGFEVIDGKPPARPWQTSELATCLATLAKVATVPAPTTGRCAHTVDLTADVAQFWHTIRAQVDIAPYDTELSHLLSLLPDAMTPDTLIHHDIRDDNLIIDATNKVYMCDWNFACVGPAWFDSLCLLISAHGDGADVSPYMGPESVFRDVPADHIDALLAGLLGYFLAQQGAAEISDSPHLRGHQRWYANATGSLLATRRGWSAHTM